MSDGNHWNALPTRKEHIMIKRMFYAFAAFGAVAALVGLYLVAGSELDNVLGRYPGSVRIANDNVDFHTIGQGAIRREATYETHDELPVVRYWYASRFNISPASDQATITGDDCAWLTESKMIIRMSYDVSVLLCPVPAGTRVVINDSLVWEQ
jgi:hypothetical protein